MEQILSDYYRIPAQMELGGYSSSKEHAGKDGFFRFGSKNVCYGQSESGVAADITSSELHDALKYSQIVGSEIRLPFDISQVVENLRRERYAKALSQKEERFVHHALIRKAYYAVREILSVPIRRHLQRIYFSDWRKLLFPNWPVDFTVDTLHEDFLRLAMQARGIRRVPFIWFWPEGAPSCLILTHDVETAAGVEFSSTLMDIDESFGFKASFQVVPEKRYNVPDYYVQQIRSRGFEFNIHDLDHDGHLYCDREEFLRRAKKINEYVRKYGARGFRAGAMHRNMDWYDAFEMSYDMSVPNVAHLEPQRGGCCTVMPYFIGNILELPLTASQDYSIIHILRDYSIDLWKIQLDLIRKRNGLMSFITHPDYLIEKRARSVYVKLLGYLQQMVKRENIWAALPGDVDQWWRARSQMKLVPNGETWEIEGPEKDRARVAYAVLDDGRLTYELADVCTRKGVCT